MSARMRWIVLFGVLACAGCGQKEKSTPELTKDLKEGSDRDRLIAVRTLPDRKGDAAQTIPALIEALKDKDPDVRKSAAIGLGTFGEQAKEAVPALEKALNDRDARVREAAGKALTRIDPVKFPAPPKSSVPKTK